MCACVRVFACFCSRACVFMRAHVYVCVWSMGVELYLGRKDVHEARKVVGGATTRAIWPQIVESFFFGVLEGRAVCVDSNRIDASFRAPES